MKDKLASWKNMLGKEEMQTILFIIGLILLFIGMLLATFQVKASGAIATYVAAFVCIAFSFLKYIETFEGLGFKLKVLQEKIDEADELLKKMRSIAKNLGWPMFTLIGGTGRTGFTVKRRDGYLISKQMEETLKSMEISQEDIEACKKDWHRYNAIDLFFLCFQGVHPYLQEKEEQVRSEMREFSGTHSPQNPDYVPIQQKFDKLEILKGIKKNIPKKESPKAILEGVEEFYDELRSFDPEGFEKLKETNNSAVEDLRYFVEHKEFRNLDRWFTMDDR